MRVQGLSLGFMASTARLVSVSLLRATRLAEGIGMKAFVQRVTTTRKLMASPRSAGPRPPWLSVIIPSITA